MKQSILIINEQNCHKAPRLKQLHDALKEDYTLILAGDQKPDYFSDEAFISLEKIYSKYYEPQHIITRILRKIGRIWHQTTHVFSPEFDRNFLYKLLKGPRKEQYNILLKRDFDLVVNHHFYTLPLAHRLASAKQVPLVLNAHEYYPSQMDPDQKNKSSYDQKMSFINDRFVKYTDLIFTVSNGIGRRYEAENNVPWVLVRNDKPFYRIAPRPTEKENIRLVHHGVAHPLRKIDTLICTMNDLPEGYELNLILVGNQDYIDELKGMVKKDNVKFHPPVPLEDIPLKLNSYDVAVFIFEPKTFNLKYVLPNKFFEAIQGRCCIVSGPSEEMSEIIEQHSLGRITEDFSAEALKKTILSLSTEDVDEAKNNCDSNAKNLSSIYTEGVIKSSIAALL